MNTWLDTLHIEQAILNTFKQQIHDFQYPAAEDAIDAVFKENTTRIQQISAMRTQNIQSLFQEINQAIQETLTVSPDENESLELYNKTDQALAHIETNYITAIENTIKPHLAQDESLKSIPSMIDEVKQRITQQKSANKTLKNLTDTREETLSPLLMRLQTYLKHRQTHYWIKDLFSSHDKTRRTTFVGPLCETLQAYKTHGGKKKHSELIQHITKHIPDYPGTHLQPLLYEIVYALQKLDQNTPLNACASPSTPPPADAIMHLLNIQNNVSCPAASKAFISAMINIYTALTHLSAHAVDNLEYQALVNELNPLFNAFIQQTLSEDKRSCTPPSQQQLEAFQSHFRITLHHKDIAMQQHRQRSKQIALHCFFGVTTLGIHTSTQLIRSKKEQGYAALLSTNRQKHIQKFDVVFQDTITGLIAAMQDSGENSSVICEQLLTTSPN